MNNKTYIYGGVAIGVIALFLFLNKSKAQKAENLFRDKKSMCEEQLGKQLSQVRFRSEEEKNTFMDDFMKNCLK